MIEVAGRYNSAKIFTDNIEKRAYEQIQSLCDQRVFEGAKVRIMPDVHSGKGCVVGFTAELNGKIIPNIVGVDIGCGVECTRLGDIEIDFKAIDDYIHQNIPHGHWINHNISNDIPPKLKDDVLQISNKTGTEFERHLRSFGSLGGGNHFIEINVDSKGDKYLVIHSGSRNFGFQIAKYYQNKAEEHCIGSLKKISHERNREIGLLKQQGKTDKIGTVIERYNQKMSEYQVPKELMYLEGEMAQEYFNDMCVAQEFARLNRIEMSKRIIKFLGLDYERLEKFTSTHNYIDPEDRVIRKGATRAHKGDRLIIPINMRDGSIIAIGKGNEDWNNSAPHGAGRVLSRSKARETLSIDEFNQTMSDVWTSTVGISTLDEAPMAYKPIDKIMDNILDTVEIVDIIKPLYNFKSV